MRAAGRVAGDGRGAEWPRLGDCLLLGARPEMAEPDRLAAGFRRRRAKAW